MANRPLNAEAGSWGTAEQLLERGDPAFVDEIRKIHVGQELADYADTWYRDTRPAARRFLLEYLDRPLDAGRHEGLVKRLFKHAEAAGDDEVMARFVVALDRSVRRQLRNTYRFNEATKQYEPARVAASPSGGQLPNHDEAFSGGRRNYYIPQGARLFSGTTRAYLRRRAWRYFRVIGKTDPARYLAGVRQFLPLYTDDDVKDGLALIDNWGLVHALFYHNDALIPNPTGWTLRDGKTLNDVKAAPRYPEVWKDSPEPLLALLDAAKSRTVRQWAIQILQADHPKALPGVPLEKLIDWLAHPSREMVELAGGLLRDGPGLGEVEPTRLLRMLHDAPKETQELLCELVGKSLKPDQVSVKQAVDLAVLRPEAMVKLGQQLLEPKVPADEAEAMEVLRLGEAESPQLRGELVKWSCGSLAKSPAFRNEWVLEYLDNRNPEVRSAGWEWLQSDDRLRDDVSIWQKLLESPYDDIRLSMIGRLEEEAASDGGVETFDANNVRLLWAAVLLNVNRGSKNKPKVVSLLIERLDRRPQEAEVLLPLLTVALRSLRGPEFRAGLVGIVQFKKRHPDLAPAVNDMIPEMRPEPDAILA